MLQTRVRDLLQRIEEYASIDDIQKVKELMNFSRNRDY
ncbi:hypothetical protein TAF16_0077 [Anoxybacillus flavithermus]|uniref:Uncharacterized protein n=1 Tax=Anoxybacillus flavithermus TaxID=33934 RepID=A0A178TPT7_9BACL|nr:hypothetical protein TAF16_0077 [Anoxybacillus flavithermus]